MIYTVTVNPAIDYVLHLTAPLAVGEINRTSDEACQFGGKGINVSGVLRELGCESIALGFTAGETGAWLERGLQLSGLKTRFIRLPVQMLQVGQRDNFIRHKYYLLMIYFQRNTAISYPDKFIKALFLLQGFVCMVRIGKDELSF